MFSGLGRFFSRWNTKEYRVEELRRTHPIGRKDEDYEKLKEEIREFGNVREPIVVKDNQVIDGNRRLQIARELGLDSITGVEG